MGFISGIDDFVFPPGQAFRFVSLDFITNDFGKISLLGSDPNQPGRNEVSAKFGLPNSAEIYSKIISSESASNHSEDIPSTPTRPDQDDEAYSSILMKLPDDLAAVFTRCLLPIGLDGIRFQPRSNLAPGKLASYFRLSGRF